ncbi:hypothetical protein EON67_05055 [archaeon]|nr:MAG: hypothetical protein EON67_05055 [archaeon]
MVCAGTTARDGGGAPAGDLARKLEELPTHSLPRAFDAVIKLRQEAVEAYVLEHGLSSTCW